MLRFTSKGQVSIEYISLFAFFLVFFIGLYIYTSYERSLYSERVDLLQAKNLADEIKEEVDLCFRVSEGYQRKLTYPSTLNGKNYEISFDNFSVTVSLGKINYTSYFVSQIYVNLTSSTKSFIIKRKNFGCIIEKI